MARKIKEKHNVPIVLLTYFNPIFRMGVENFFSLAKKCHVDGVIVPDLPVEEAHEYKKVSEAYEIDTIFLATPSTSIERLQEIINYTSGFLYLVSVFGVTGARENVQDLTIQQIKRFLPYTKARIPLAVGFGISQPEHVKAVINSGADGAIVGSAFVNIIQRNRENIPRMLEKVEQYTLKLKDATKKHA
jgi:tryptophan synthase alpha chain